jgi:ornithine decarboxylase
MSVAVHPLRINYEHHDPQLNPSYDNLVSPTKPLDNVYNLKEDLYEYIDNLINKESLEEAFYIFNYSTLISQYFKWIHNLPRVKPFYAVKCNNHPAILQVLSNLGCGFDCASTGEIKMIKEMNVCSSNIVFANPCKLNSHIRFAKSQGVSRMTFDNVDELYKIKSCYPEAELILRILPDDSSSMCRFGSKFGAAEDTWPALFATAKELDLNIIGISYHVGSGCRSAYAFVDAIHLARKAFDLALKNGFNMTLLDIGGGFNGNVIDTPYFEDVAELIRPVLDELFPNVTLIAEPGRYFASATMTLVSKVHSRRKYSSEGKDKFLYYIDEGLYGSLNCIIFDHQTPKPVKLNNDGDSKEYESNIFGPTCDSMDLVAKDHLMPELVVGDWLVFENMGAYTYSAASNFNGFRTTNIYFVKAWS